MAEAAAEHAAKAEERSTRWIFLGAGLFNAGLVPVSFFTHLGKFDPMFTRAGCGNLGLWGLAYASLYNRYHLAPATSVVFGLEKLFYTVRWLGWMQTSRRTLPGLWKSDKLAASVLSFYGIVDGLFCVLFFRTAYLHRNNLLGSTGAEETLQAVVKSSMKKSVAKRLGM
mmetsp:Transcript_32695/g.86381  ORF Transcript_32695/g.86381 Transcript_32695/m.86381 type:complete len:169 (+) Transcript_32695:89-595(+)